MIYECFLWLWTVLTGSMPELPDHDWPIEPDEKE